MTRRPQITPGGGTRRSDAPLQVGQPQGNIGDGGLARASDRTLGDGGILASDPGGAGAVCAGRSFLVAADFATVAGDA